jgi:L-iditol 2-dehydrogenase
MKAAVIRGPLSMKIEERPVPSVKENEVLVRVRAAGICGSDIHGFLGNSGKRRLPGLIMGHEAAGEVFELGSEVAGFAKGDRVAIDPQISCGQCVPCREGYANLCDNMMAIGSSMRKFCDGAMCEYIALPSRVLHKLAADVSFAEGAMVEPIANALHVMSRAGLKIGDTLAIFGAGTLGLILVQLAVLSGAGRIISIDVSEKRLAMAKGFGANVLVRADREDSVARVLEETNGMGADIVIEAAGPSVTYSAAIRSVRKRGKVAALGFSQAEVEIPVQSLLFREITIIGCGGFTSECETGLALLARKQLDVKPLITHEFPLDDVQLAFTKASDPSAGAVKIMILLS